MCWFNKSSDLRAAAAAVWTSMDNDLGELIVKDCRLGGGFNMGVAVSPVFHMLCGMAMELIFKALTVEHGCKVNDSSHDLLSHLAGTGLSYSDNERELLKILSHDITWAGRYPTPKKKNTSKPTRISSERIYSTINLWAPDHYACLAQTEHSIGTHSTRCGLKR